MSSADFINYLAGRYARSVHPLSGGVMRAAMEADK